MKMYLKLLNKNVVINFTKELDNKWIGDNIATIKKTFDIRTKKYDNFNYYNIYILLITVLRNLFDNNLFIKHITKINYTQYIYYVLNEKIYEEHLNIIQKINNNLDFLNFND